MRMRPSCGPRRSPSARLFELDFEQQPAVGAGGEEVLDRLGALAAFARRLDLGAERDQCSLQVAAGGCAAGRRAQIPSERRLAANLVICDVACRGPERLWRLLELGHRRHRTDRQRGAVARDSRQPGVLQQQDPIRPEPSVVDLGHQDRAAAQHGHAGAVAEGVDRLVPARWGR